MSILLIVAQTLQFLVYYNVSSLRLKYFFLCLNTFRAVLAVQISIYIDNTCILQMHRRVPILKFFGTVRQII